MSFKKKVILIVTGVFFVFTLAIMLTIKLSFSNSVYSEKQNFLSSQVDIANGIIKAQLEELKQGKISKVEAQKKSIEALRDLRFGIDHDDYFFIYDFAGNCVMLPTIPEREGKNFIDLKDKNDFPFIKAMAEVSKDKGFGYVEYAWFDKKDNKRIVPKLSFVHSVPEWNWFFGTGIYIDDVQQNINRNLLNILIVAVISISISIFGFVYIVNRQIIHPLEKITNAASELSAGRFTKIELEKGLYEFEILANGLNQAQSNIQKENKYAEDFVRKVTASPIPVLDLNEKMEIVYANKPAVDWCRHSETSILNKKFSELFVHPSYLNKLEDFNQVLNGTSLQGELLAIRDNKTSPIKYFAIPIRNEQQKIIGMTIFIVDLRDIYSIISKVSSASLVIDSVARNLLHASSIMHNSTDQLNALSKGAKNDILQVNEHISSVASSSEESSANMSNVAAAAEEMSQGISTIATAVEELNASFSEIASNTTQASQIAKEAATKTEVVNEAMQTLQETAKNIGQVVGMISKIADQTNMLALNATIEAASAGEAGKGFAVVASEVKELAKQTAESTSEIEERIKEIQASTQLAGDSIKTVVEIIEKLHGQNQVVAAAVEEQTATAREISKTINEASKAANEVARNSEQGSLGIHEIAKSSTEVAQKAQDLDHGMNFISTASNNVLKNSNFVKNESTMINQELTGINQMIQQFQMLKELEDGSYKPFVKSIDNALEAHGAWTKRLQSAVDEGHSDAQPEVVATDNNCTFGKWLYRDLSPSELQSPRCQKIVKLHADFHHQAGTILKLALSGQKNEAQKLLAPGSDFASISGELYLELGKWRVEKLREHQLESDSEKA